MRLFVPAFKGFFKNKKLKIYIIAISITFGIIISAIYSLYLFNEVYSDKIKNNIKNRVLYAGKTEISQNDIEDIRKIDGVEDVYRILANASLNFENDGITILTKSTSIKEIPSIAEGTGFTDDKEVQVIFPSKINSMNDQSIDLHDYIGKYVDFYADEFSIRAKVCGIYDVKNSECAMYINEEFRQKLIEFNPAFESSKSVNIIVDDYENVNNVIDTLKSLKYSSNLNDTSGQIEVKYYNIAKALIIIILLFTVVFTYISITIIINGIISDEFMDIAILKAIGYKIKQISKILKYRILAIIGISTVIGIILSIIFNQLIFKIINYKLGSVLINKYNIYALIVLLFVFGIYIIVILSTIIIRIKIKKVNTIELLKEN